MSEIVCELLGLDRDVVNAHAEAYRGLAYALATRETWSETKPDRSGRPVQIAITAHYLAIAAGYLGAADPAEAGSCFEEATEWARRQVDFLPGNEPDVDQRQWGWRRRALLLDACRPAPTLQEDLSAIIPTERPLAARDVGELLLIVMRQAASGGANREWASEAIERLSGPVQEQSMMPVGVLQIPLGFVIRLARLFSNDPAERSVRDLVGWGRDFAVRLAERVAIAQANRSQWRALHTRLLPIEPEALLAVQVWREITMATMREGSALPEILSTMPPAMQAYAESARLIFKDTTEEGRPRFA